MANRPGTAGNRPASPGTGKIVKHTLNDGSSQKVPAKSKGRLRSASPAGSQANNN